MEFSTPAVVLGVFVNTIWCIAMYVIQQGEAKAGMIQAYGTKVTGTDQQFLHWQDFYCQRWGNTIGLAILAVGFCHLVGGEFMTPNQWVVFLVVAIGDAVGFTLMCLGKNHKPDWGFPEVGEVSWCGLCHSMYHGINIAMATFCVWHLIIGNFRGNAMWLTLAGGVFYLLCNAADLKTGHFDQIKYSRN